LRKLEDLTMHAPGRLEVTQLGGAGRLAFRLLLTYRQPPGPAPREVFFNLSGTLDGRPLDDTFVLPADRAFDFLHEVDLRLRRLGLPVELVPVFTLHRDYDPFFADLQRALGRHPGDPMDLAHLD